MLIYGAGSRAFSPNNSATSGVPTQTSNLPVSIQPSSSTVNNNIQNPFLIPSSTTQSIQRPIFTAIRKSIWGNSNLSPPQPRKQQFTAHEDAQIQASVEQFRSSIPKYTFSAVKLCFASPEFIERNTVVKCTDGKIDGGGPNSVNSEKMGPVDQYHVCSTCHLKYLYCHGHPGLIELAVALPNPQTLSEIVEILNCLCGNCGRVLLPESYHNDPSILRTSGIQRFKLISKKVQKLSLVCPRNLELAREGGEVGSSESKIQSCQPINASKNCPNQRLKYTAPTNSSDPNILVTTLPFQGSASSASKIQRPIDIEKISCLFNKINPKDLKLLGFSQDSHPRNLILRVLSVIPEANRPSVERDGIRKHDHLTHAYSAIIRANEVVRKMLSEETFSQKKPDESKLAEAIGKLYFYVSHLMDNSDGQYKLHKEEPANVIKTRLTGKEGYCRKLAQGKRGNGVTRSILGPGVIPFGTVILPGAARGILIPERANMFNLAHLNELARLGEVFNLVRGAGPPNEKGSRIHLVAAMERAKRDGAPLPQIYLGDLVYRFASSGDDAAINRQPSIHKHSFIGCRVLFRLGQHNCRIHMSYTKNALNGDFDGDEINSSLPATLRAMAEVRHLLAAKKQIISGKNSSPVMTLQFNAPISAYLLSKDAMSDNPRRNFTLTRQEWNGIVTNLLVDSRRADSLSGRLKKEGVAERSLRALWSLVFPADFYYRRGYKEVVTLRGEDGKILVDENGQRVTKEIPREVLIRNGVFISGVMDNDDVGKLFIQELMYYGDEVTARFLTEGTFILDWFLERRGFSLRLFDCLLSDRKAGAVEVQRKIGEVFNQIEVLRSVVPRTAVEADLIEGDIRAALASVETIGDRLIAGEIAGTENPLGVMISSKAKGTVKNLAQISGVLGQQFVEGAGRPPLNYYGKRCLPYFEAGDDTPAARGFVGHSFSEGMLPSEFIFHQMPSRDGLLNTALSTSKTGHIHNRLLKILSNYRVDYFGGITNNLESIVSPSYGEGFQPERLVMVKGFMSTGDLFMPFDVRKVVEKLNSE